jgi:predicted porin
MNNKIKLAVAGAVLSATSIANAGIIIPAGDWTLDVNGNVNAFASWSDADDANAIDGGLTQIEVDGEGSGQGINTGLLPAWLGFTGTTRQNDVDVSFTISFQPNVSDNSTPFHGDSATPLNRQAFLTFGDKSWGTVKLGKDLGIFAGDAILNDMTLLGVGAGGATATSGGATTLGGIGTGYIYPAWKGQVAYTTPNMNGFEATIAITNPNQVPNNTSDSTHAATTQLQERFGIEAKASYSWTGDVAGKVWVSGASYDYTVDQSTSEDYNVSAWDIGTAVTSGNLGLVAYYYEGKGAGTTIFGQHGYDVTTDKRRDSDGGYLQATYVIPTGTKLGVSYGVSNLDEASGETGGELVDSNERWTVGAYHPLTKHLNLVAEYNKMESEAQGGNENEADAFSLGAILFF